VNHPYITGFLLAFIFAQTPLMGQGVSKSYFLTNFKQASAVIPFQERFQFENFRKGLVTKITGTKTEAKLNYSYLNGDILFIAASRDTLSIADVNLVKNVAIGETIYFYDPKYGFAEIIADHNDVKIGKRSQWALVEYQNSNNYEKMEAPTSKQTTFVKMPANNKIESLTNLTLKPQLSFFLIDKNNRFHMAQRDSFLRIYARNKKKVATYLNSHDVDYRNESDLRKAVAYCTSLTDLP
jgi:hypothetical protein